MTHFLAPPYGLPEAGDARLTKHLQDDDWAAATTLLRDVVSAETTNWRWLVLLAYVRFRDASDVMVDELTPAAREALGLLERAMHHGAPLGEVAPFREAVETALDHLTRDEEALRTRWESARESLSLEELEQVAFLLKRDAPAKAGEAFEALYAKRPSPGVKALAALARGADQPTLEALLSEQWSKEDRLVLEEVETALLEQVSGAEFVAHWQLAEAKGRELDFPFPTAWPHQERLFSRAWALGDFALARRLGARMKEERSELPKELREKLEAAPSVRE